MNEEDMYQEYILDYYRNPRNCGKLQNPDIIAEDFNPACGDKIEIMIKVKDNKIAEIKFNGKGCAISQASASMLTEEVLNKSMKEIIPIDKKYVLDMLGINLSPMRLKCALLGLKVLKLGVYNYLGKKMVEDYDN